MAEPDLGLYFVFQVVRIGCFRCDKGIERELRAEAKAGDETVEGGLSVDRRPGINVLDKSFLFFTRQFIREEVLTFVERLHIMLHLFVLLGASRLRVNIAVVKLFNKAIQFYCLQML